MATLTVQNIAKTGLNPVYGAVALSDTFLNVGDERNYLHVKNGSGASINVTVVAQKTQVKVPGVGQLTIANQIVAVPAGQERIIGPFSEAFNDANGMVVVNYSAITTVTAAALRLAPDSL